MRSPRKSKQRMGKELAPKKLASSSAISLTAKAANREAFAGKRMKGKGTRKPASRTVPPPDDSQMDHVPGVPDDEQIKRDIGRLAPADRRAFNRLRELLVRHLGSDAAARLWLLTPSPGFETTPLDAIRQGKGNARQLAKMLEAEWGTTPTYA